VRNHRPDSSHHFFLPAYAIGRVKLFNGFTLDVPQEDLHDPKLRHFLQERSREIRQPAYRREDPGSGRCLSFYRRGQSQEDLFADEKTRSAVF
jgi:hypothetical protein